MTPKQIGAAVRKARGQRSIRKVAGAAGLSRHQVTSIEQGTTAYTINSLLALCKVVGLHLHLLCPVAGDAAARRAERGGIQRGCVI